MFARTVYMMYDNMQYCSDEKKGTLRVESLRIKREGQSYDFVYINYLSGHLYKLTGCIATVIFFV